MLASSSMMTATYNEPVRFYTKKNIKTKAESKKCKSCKKFNTHECHFSNVSPMDIAKDCYIKRKRRKR